MKISELKIKRAELFAKSRAFEGEDVTDEQLTELEQIQKQIQDLDRRIKAMEKQEEYSVAFGGGEKKEIKAMAQKFSLSKAIAELKTGSLSGLEKEIAQEGAMEFQKVNQGVEGLIIPQRFLFANETTVTGAGHIPTEIKGLDIIASSPLYRELGVTEYNDLSAAIKIPISDGHGAAFISEEGDAPESTPTNGVIDLAIKRVSGYKVYANEYLAQSTVMAAMIEDMTSAIDRAITKELLAKAVVANIVSGKGTAGTAEALTFAKALSFKAALNSSIAENVKYVASNPLFYGLMAALKDAGSGRFLVEDGILAGSKIFGTELLPGTDATHRDLVAGDWKRAYVGKWSGLQLVVDGMKYAGKGQTVITFTQLANCAVDSRAFVSYRNLNNV